jgi:hypothetical protein
VQIEEGSVQHQTRELITALSTLAGALFVIVYVIPYHIELEQEFEFASLSPAFFPRLAAWIIAGLSALQLAIIVTQRKKRAVADPDKEWLSPKEERSAYKSALVVIAYFFALKYVGFLIATTLLLAALLILQNIKKPLKVILISVPVTLGVFLFFYFIMQVHFPKGVIFE